MNFKLKIKKNASNNHQMNKNGSIINSNTMIHATLVHVLAPYTTHVQKQKKRITKKYLFKM